MAELFLELFSEEIPARMQARASEDLKRLVTEKLKEAGLIFTDANAYATPRRLVLTIDGLPLAQPDVIEEKRGPRVDAPDKAIQGFVRANNLVSISEAERRQIDKGEFYFAVKHRAGKPTSEVLAEKISEAMLDFSWPKSMRWSAVDLNGDAVTPAFTWIRPLKSIIALFNGERLPGGLALGRLDLPGKTPRFAHPDSAPATDQSILVFGAKAVGHRFLDPREFTVAGYADYKVKLREAFVIVDPTERRAAIKEQADKLAAADGLTVKPDDALLDEVTGLVEWPVALMGRIDEQFMDIPPEVLTTSMRVNQKYFSLLEKSGKLAPRFIVVANMATKDGGKAIVAGNERVLRARLSDAKFFWDQDRKVKLEERVPALKHIVFHAKLGTVADKVSRMQTLAAELVPYIPGADVDQVRSAALLAKADLTTGMVGEFPELQGVMGRYYAIHEGEKQAVADAIAEHYAPLGPNDRCPTAPVGVAVALADKIDLLVGFFAIDEKPTGSKDPFALRRAALGVIRLIVENKLKVRLTTVLRKALNSYLDHSVESLFGVEGLNAPNGSRVREKIVAELLDFFGDRLRVALRDKGIRHDLIRAVFALRATERVSEDGAMGEVDLLRVLARVDALRSFLDTDDGANLLTAYRRAANIVAIEEKRDGKTYSGVPDDKRFVQDEEKKLNRTLLSIEKESDPAIGREHFADAMRILAALRTPVDTFFEKVTVNCEDPELRKNRLHLLARIRWTMDNIADFSQIEG